MKVYRIANEEVFRNWDTGEPVENSEAFEGVYYLVGNVSGWMETWLENGERAYGRHEKEEKS